MALFWKEFNIYFKKNVIAKFYGNRKPFESHPKTDA